MKRTTKAILIAIGVSIVVEIAAIYYVATYIF